MVRTLVSAGELSLSCARLLAGCVVTHPASSLAQDRESSPAETSVLTTMLCRQQCSAKDVCHDLAVKPSAIVQPTWPTQPSIPQGMIMSSE